MDPDTRQKVETRLLDEIAETEERIVEFERIVEKPIAPDNAIGRISRIDAMQDQKMTGAALNKSREKLDRLEAALQRIHDPEFGVCVTCRDPIPLERLLLMPQSTQCVHCASS